MSNSHAVLVTSLRSQTEDMTPTQTRRFRRLLNERMPEFFAEVGAEARIGKSPDEEAGMTRKNGKIETIKAAWEQAQTQAQELREQHNRLGEEFKTLQSKNSQESDPLERARILERMKVIVKLEEPELHSKLERQLLEAHRLEVEHGELSRRYRAAQAVLERLGSNDPTMADIHPGEKAQAERQARRIIQELT